MSAWRVAEANELAEEIKRNGEERKPPEVEARRPVDNKMADSNAAPVVRFGSFELNLHLREIRKQGVRLRMEAKPFLILESLLERAGEVVTRQALCDKLWPDTHVGYEHSLNTAVNKLRSILCDIAQNPRFVETLPRLGYRFIAPVQRLDRSRPLAVASNGADVASGERRASEPLVRRSSRPQRVQEPPLQAKNCQTAP